MKPVAIFRASPTEGPGYFATYLERRSIAWQLVALDADARVPRDARDGERLLPEPGLCPRQALRHAVPRRDDRGAGEELARERQRRNPGRAHEPRSAGPGRDHARARPASRGAERGGEPDLRPVDRGPLEELVAAFSRES